MKCLHKVKTQVLLSYFLLIITSCGKSQRNHEISVQEYSYFLIKLI